MSTRDERSFRPDTFLIPDRSRLPELLREPIEGVSFAAYLLVEAARLDELASAAVLGWLGVRESVFARTEERWNDLLADELARESTQFDEIYEDLLGRALSLWARPVDPLDRDVEAWITFQRHALAADNPGEMARRAGLTPGDELRLARLWRGRLATPDIAARGAATWSGPLLPLPELRLAPIAFPPTLEQP